MEEQKKIERDLMSQEEFENYIEDNKVLHLVTYEAVNKFKSIRRAIKRSNVTSTGYIIPKRPFHNRANTCKRKGKHSRPMNELKKRIYAELKQYQQRRAS